jgi:hypothetical protein
MRLVITTPSPHPPEARARMSWASLLKRVFDIDMEYCANCGGRRKIIAAIVDPAVIAKILTHLHLLARAPRRINGATSRPVPGGLIAHSSSVSSRLTPKPTIPLAPAFVCALKTAPSRVHESPQARSKRRRLSLA